MNYRNMRTVLTIAGSDCSGGAGIQADIKTIEANGCYAMSAITALTAQNTVGVKDISNVSPDFLKKQLDACFDDMDIDAVKIGMVSEGSLIRVIADVLHKRRVKNIIVDPVMVSTSGSRLISEDAVSILKDKIFPIASLITPNIPEAEILTEMKIQDSEDMIKAGRLLSGNYNSSILIKGGHSVNDSTDILVMGDMVTKIDGKRIENDNTHGTGCTLSSAIAAGLARGNSMEDAIRHAKNFISGALKYGINLGHGSGPLNHIWDNTKRSRMKKLLAQSLKLYGVTDGRGNDDGNLCDKVLSAIRGGMTFLQLREKNVTDEQYIKDAMDVKELADRYNVPLIINDNVAVAKQSHADGVHLGQDDMRVDEARIRLGEDKIIGATAHSVSEALHAEALGADYLGVGAVFRSSTKDNTTPITYDTLKDICEHVSIPVVAISGINQDNIWELVGSGISGVAVVSAIFGGDDVEASARIMRHKVEALLLGETEKLN